VVLDTNVLVSALLFRSGRLSWLRQAWQTMALRPVMAKPTTEELLRVLAYPKFRLTSAEVEALLEELLPWVEVFAAPIPSVVKRWTVRDPKDQIFLDLALGAGVDLLLTGDADLLVLSDQVEGLQICQPADLKLS
jgi:putative PIN family toxin of toxin-antitoxin system